MAFSVLVNCKCLCLLRGGVGGQFPINLNQSGKLTVTRRMCRPFGLLRFVGRVWNDLYRKHCEHTEKQCNSFGVIIRSVYHGCLMTIIPRARMGSESIAPEAEGRMGY